MLTNYYLKTGVKLFIYTVVGVIIAVFAGYFCGAVGGIILTFYNNNFLTETAPQGSYLWWANFCGRLIAIFAILPGAIGGLFAGIVKLIWSRKVREK